MRFVAKIAVIIVVTGVIAGSILFWPRRYEATFYPMGGIPFKVVTYGRTMFQFDDDLAAVEGRVAELERVFNRFDKSSELSRMNKEASVTPVTLSNELRRAFDLSRKWYLASNRAFDPTVGPLVDLWKKAGREGILPSERELEDTRGLVGMDRISTTADGRVLFTRTGMNLDFGGIAKGLIAEEAATTLKQRGVRRAILQAGGDTYAFGEGTFLIGIQDPTAKSGEKIMGTVDIIEGAITTSGNYERYVEINGRRYSHIIDPRTGRPVENPLVSTTVVGRSGADADAMATALMVLGLEDGTQLVKRVGGFGAVLVKQTDSGFETYVSKSLAGRLRLNDEWTKHVVEF